MNGPIAHNIYVDAKCKCGIELGLIIKAPNYKCGALKDKLLIRSNMIKCYAFEKERFIKMKIEDAFKIEEFEDRTILEGRSSKISKKKFKQERSQEIK